MTSNAALRGLVAWMWLAAPALAQPGDGTSLGSIRGTVIDASTGAPIPGVEITTALHVRTPPDTAPPLVMVRDTYPHRAVTDQTGQFELADLKPATYLLSIRAPGYVPLRDTRGIAAGYEVTAGGVIEGLQFRLTPGVSISGRIVDQNGRPVLRATVSALNPPASGNGPRPRVIGVASSGTTNEVGEFHLTGLEPGEYVVATFPMRSPLMQTARENIVDVVTFYPGVTEIEGAQRISVSVGHDARDVEFSMQRSPAVNVSGSVHDEQGRVPAEAMVNLVPQGSPMPFRSIGGRTKADGTFVITGVPPGEYSVQATEIRRISWSAGGPAGAATVPPMFRPPGNGLAITVGSEDVTGLSVTLTPAGAVPRP
jgi:hypothetical protein